MSRTRSRTERPELARFLRHLPQPFTRADAEAFVQVNMTEPWETLPAFAVVHDDHVIGTVNFDIDPAKRRAMIGYAIARAHWGRGIATEAATAAIDWASPSTVSPRTGPRRIKPMYGRVAFSKNSA